ncbi:MAG: hypothetical protein H0W08_23430 [Acidobacteria bacterium]|nr:hypothetical protein [Acidobacteriota bacterium]
MARKPVSEARALGAIIVAKEAVEEDLLQRAGVTGVDVGYKYVGGERTDEIAIRVLVRNKGNVPKAQQVPATINGIPTDVIERTFELHADTGRYTPVRGGISIGPCRAIGGFVFTGTLGAIVRDNATGNPMLLSNFHVMCVDNGWAVGDQMAQPSRVDTGSCPGDVVGTLQRAVLSASVDGAVSSLAGRTHSCEIVDIGNVEGTTAATMGMAVRKRGRTTSLTHGTVDSVSLSVNVDYGDGLGTRTLTNQIGLAPNTALNPSFGERGDSGSVVVNAARQVVGLYFAGSSDGTGVANPIAAVLSALNISMCVGAAKLPKREIKELKREKPEAKELKIEKREIKELKREKPEAKELKIEKREIKEKPEKFEIEGQKVPDIGGRPPILRSDTSTLEERVAQLEELVGQLTTFITPEERPELGGGALLQEGDVSGGELDSMSQQLEKETGDAMQVKANHDIKPGDR